MVFTTPYKENRFKTPPEENSGKTLVETAGYMSAQKRIENMILAGQRLVDYRKSQFDFPEGEIDESFEDPTRSPNFDLADASQIQIQAEASLKASQTSQGAPQSVQTAPEEVNLPEPKFDPFTGQPV